jgi:uncharacterized protein
MKLFEPRGEKQGERRDQHLPTRVPIDAYGDGGFRFGDMSHRGSILCLPSGVHGWAVNSMAEVSPETLAPVIAEAAASEFLIIGTGRDIAPLPRAAAEALRAAGLRFEPMSTGSAIRMFNIMLGEDRKVAACLIAVD